jgi:hypothetical protein
MNSISGEGLHELMTATLIPAVSAEEGADCIAETVARRTTAQCSSQPSTPSDSPVRSEVGSIEYQPNGSDKDTDLVPEEQMTVFVTLSSKDQVKLYLDYVSFNESSIETQKHQLGLHCPYRKNNHPFPHLHDYAASISPDMAIDYLFIFGVPVWSTLAYNYTDSKRTGGEKMLLRNRVKINAEIKVMKETARFFRAVGTRSEATQPKDLNPKVVIVANFAVLRAGELMANPAIGATGN